MSGKGNAGPTVSMLTYGMSKVATMRTFSINMKAFDGKPTFTAGKWMMNYMPLIIPQI